MTGDAVNALADMRSVIESDMRFLNPAPDALPGNVLSLVVIGFQLVDLLAVRQGRRVTIPACPNVGKRSDGATFDRNGNATGGLSLSPLEHFLVAVDATGAITIDMGTTVDPASRKAV